DWVVQRLDDEGRVVIAKDGGADQWVSSEKHVLKTYTVGAEVLSEGGGVVYTKTGNVVFMIELAADVQILTPWGTQNGKVGDYLANYDYDFSQAIPGSDFAVVARDSWEATYELCS
ncbi:MAG: hypothetical protein K2X27_23635, partial [Candidatus Obscuribacterales bacterium]|nr:hypothetical protein [Candidatus Obscuribacterales bacterium]